MAQGTLVFVLVLKMGDGGSPVTSCGGYSYFNGLHRGRGLAFMGWGACGL